MTHASCNRTKQDSHLAVARILYKFEGLKEKATDANRGPNLQDVLLANGGSQYSFSASRNNGNLVYSLPKTGDNRIQEAPIFHDELSGFEYVFLLLPIEYVHHDDEINPRGIGSNISKLVKEFFQRRPQLHVALGWIDLDGTTEPRIKIFDGQHKAAAQIMLGIRKLPVRIFVNPDRDILLTTNTNAGTKLRQVAFDKSVQRHLGSQLYAERIQRFQKETGRDENDFGFSEQDLQNFFKGEFREVKRYVIDAVRDSITHNEENLLKEYIDFGGKKTDRPLSYSTIEKTFYSFFIYQSLLDTPINYLMEEGENPRELEKEQILKVMNIIAEEIYIGKFHPEIGTGQLENKVRKGESVPLDHLKAFRMSKEEVLYNWLSYIGKIIQQGFIVQGRAFDEAKLFQYRFPPTIWDPIRLFLRNFSNLPLWINRELSSTIFGGKQNLDYWAKIFETGSSPQGVSVLVRPINLNDLMKE